MRPFLDGPHYKHHMQPPRSCVFPLPRDQFACVLSAVVRLGGRTLGARCTREMRTPIPRAATAPLLCSSSGSSSGSSSPRKSSSSLPTHWRRAAAPADAATCTRRSILAAATTYSVLLLLGVGVLYSRLQSNRGRSSPEAEVADPLSPAALERALQLRGSSSPRERTELWPPGAAVVPNVEFSDAGRGLPQRPERWVLTDTTRV